MTEIDYVRLGDGCRIAFRFDGPEEAPPLLLSNSLGTDFRMWDAQIPAWAAHARILRYDTRGHGQSDAPAGAYSIDRLGRDVIELADALGIGRFDFCGLSLGGMVGQWLGIREADRLNRLVLANTSSYMGPPSGWDQRIELAISSGMAPLAEASVSRWFTPAFAISDPARIQPVEEMLLGTDRHGYAACCAAIRDMDMRRFVSLIEVPTLVIGGAHDPATPLASSAALVEGIAGARLVTLDAAHLSNVEQPEAFAAAVSEHLSRRQ